MKVILQRVSEASVRVDGECIASIERGLLLLVGIGEEDTPEVFAPMAEKIIQMRVFPDSAGRFHHSLLEVQGGLLLVPQFTLFANTSKGRRPDFFGAMKPPQASDYFESFVAQFRERGVSRVEQGKFGADMKVSLVNDGPVTISLES